MNITQEILSDITVFNKYAKHIPEIKRRETFDELCDRNVAMHVKKYPQLKEKIQQVYNKFVRNKKVLPSMRSMQFAGAPIEISNVRIFNCSYFPIDHPFAFAELMFLLLSGTGVGYSVQKHHIDKLPVVVGPSERKRRFLIGDSIEGWAEAIKVLIKAYTQGKSTPEFDFRDIRPKGSKLITSGGKAPGPDPLRICIDQVRAILNNAVGRKLTTLEVHDICCHIADAVLAGGIRRAAMIALFDRDDHDMLSCKSGAWWELNPQRGRANNSAVLPRGEVTEEEFKKIWKLVEMSGSGEPGFYWTNNIDWGANPCISGDALITVCDHGVDNESVGLPYQIPMKMLVDIVNSSNLPPYALTLNLETGEKEWKPILAAALTKRNAEMVQIEADGRVLKCTPDHKIFTKNRGWVEAQHLEETDELAFI
jgi:ribonucleoside-diphosphate reductase alpha chain